MAKAYTKEFLVNAFLSRYVSLPDDKFEALQLMADAFYDSAGKEKFRVYCSLTPEALNKARKTGLC